MVSKDLTLTINLSTYAPITMTDFVKKDEIKNNWVLIDAENAIVGRLAAYISKVLRGKDKNQFTPHMDIGDFVVVTNVEKIKFTGKKTSNKKYYWHTGYPGGIKDRTADQLLDGPHPERVIEKAVERMLPKGKLGRKQIGKLKIYSGLKHPHDAQSPETLDIAKLNSKNKRNN